MSSSTSSSPSRAGTEIHYVAVDQSYDAMQLAREKSQKITNAMATEALSGNWLQRRSGWIRNNIWRGGLAKEYLNRKHNQEVQQQIRDNGGVLDYEASAEERERIRLLEVERFLHEGDEFLHADAGEVREQLDDGEELVGTIKDLIRRNVTGSLSDAALLEERTRALNEYQKEHGSGMARKGLARVDNMLEIAAAVKGAMDHGEALDTVLANMKISLGESRSGVRTETQYTKVEKAIDRLAETKFGAWVGPETVIAGATLATSVLGALGKTGVKKGSLLAVGAAAATMPVLVVPVALAGGWAALRERKRIKDDRTQHMREMAQGSEIQAGSKRREQLETTRYTTESATDLMDKLNARFKGSGAFGEDYESTDRTAELRDINEALTVLSLVEDRIHLSDARSIDLITYSSADKVREERLALDIARMQAKSAAQARLEDPDLRRLMGIDDTVTLDGLLDAKAAELRSLVEDDISEKDRVFGKLRRRSMAMAGAKGAAIGWLVGETVQEVHANLSDDLAGARDVVFGGEHPGGDLHSTIPGATIDSIKDSHDSFSFGDGGELHLSHNLHFVTSEDGVMSLTDRDGSVLVDNLQVDAHGYFTPESMQAIEGAGISIEDISQTGPDTITEMNLHEYLEAHDGETVDVTRDMFFHNDTPTYSDGNELRLLWGGEGSDVGVDGTGVTGDGSYQLSVASMIPGESSVGGTSPEWPGDYSNMKFFVSASVDGQMEPFQFDVNPDGTIDIPADHPAAQFFRVDGNGHAEFIGKYAEVAQVNDIDADGVTHISPLATAIGTDEAQYGVFPGAEHQPEYILTSSETKIVEPPPIIPIVPRRSLETLRAPSPGTRRGRGYYDYYGGSGREVVPPGEISPRLRNNPGASLNPREELEWYRSEVRTRRGDSYVADIDRLIDGSPELTNLPTGLTNIITIPVNASGAAEADGIYNMLTRAYGSQDGDTLRDTTILLHVNWFDDALGDPDKKARIEKTRAEIARAKADNPQLNIAIIESEWKRAEITGGVIGHVARRQNDVAMLALERAMRSGRVPSDQDVLIIRNDADLIGISRNYLKNYVEAAEKNPETDIFTGTTTFDNTKANDLPGFVFASNFMQSLNLIASGRGQSVHTAGANFGIRASMLAAVSGTGFSDGDTGGGTDDVNLGRRIVYARDRSGSVGSSDASYYGSSLGASRSATHRRKIAHRVLGARIDTDSDREEALYRKGIPIIHTWDGGAFDVGGYADRDSGLGSGTAKESLWSDPDTVIERIRNDMEGTMNVSGPESEPLIRTGLAFMFWGRPAKDAYRLTQGGDGKWHFEFTKYGKQEVIKHLTRDQKGKFDPYGNRKLRQMYGEIVPGSSRTLGRTSTMARA